jgi:gamma-glutamyltranspeptidase/glutathione hydrolase
VNGSAALALAAALWLAGCALSPAASRDAPGHPALQQAAPEQASGRTAKTTRYATTDMVAAAHPLAVAAGVRALAAGGSATDAAIAAQLALNVVEPQSSGIGGGGFLLHYDAAGAALTAWDGRETAPAAATATMLLDAGGRPKPFFDAVDGGLSVGTPGLLRMLEQAHAAHGRLPWPALFEDAIRLAEEGFEISPRLHRQIAAAAARIAAQGEPVRSHFLKPDGSPKDAGTRLRNPELAATLRAVAAGGADAFYRGPIAQAIVEVVRSHPRRPGTLALQDLAAYRAKQRPAPCGGYRSHVVCSVGPPSSGGIAVLQTLGILGHFELGALAPGSIDAVHLVGEAWRLAYADRDLYVADPDRVDVPVAGLLDPAYLSARATLVARDRAMGPARAGTPPGAPVRGAGTDATLPSTTHLSVVDRHGNAVSMTTSIEHGFGSLLMVGGFLLNNQLTDFSFEPVDAQGRPVANRVEPGKRPRSTMAPTMVFDAAGRFEAALGSPGGTAIVHYVVKTLLGLIDWGLDIQQSIDLPNFAAFASGPLLLERGTALEALRSGLEARGHAVRVVDLNSGVHGIVYNGADPPGALARDPSRGRWAGGADPRREGTAGGTR